VVKGDMLLELWPTARGTEALRDKLHSKFVIGDYRTQDQDPGFLFDQFVEVASRALSAGINDHFTALLAIDRIRAGLSFMTEREIPSAYRFDNEELRVIAAPLSFETAVRRSFGPIRRHGADSLQIVLRLLDTLEVVARRTTTAANREVLRGEAGRVRESAQRALVNSEDREEAERRYREIVGVLGEEPSANVATPHQKIAGGHGLSQSKK
jgi:uncharacterized membrane protein